MLREKMEQDLWKTVLKGEAAMLEKEGALNEVQAQREKLWAEREALVAAMRSELDAEQQRMAAAWRSGRTEWEAMQAEHNELRSQLAQRAVEIDALQQRVVAEMAGAVATLQAERELFAQERGLCRDERSVLSRALVWHRGEGSPISANLGELSASLARRWSTAARCRATARPSSARWRSSHRRRRGRRSKAF